MSPATPVEQGAIVHPTTTSPDSARLGSSATRAAIGLGSSARGRAITKVGWLREQFEPCWQLRTGSRHGPLHQFDRAVTDYGENSRRTPGGGSPVTADASGDRDGAPVATAKSAPTTKSEPRDSLMPTPGPGRVAAHTGQGLTHRSSALPAAGNGGVPIEQ